MKKLTLFLSLFLLVSSSLVYSQSEKKYTITVTGLPEEMEGKMFYIECMDAEMNNDMKIDSAVVSNRELSLSGQYTQDQQ